MLLWGVALLVRRLPGRFAALMLIVLSLTVSCRYIWWRYTSTLNWNDPLSLAFGLGLLFAETYAWLVLVMGYFQVVWPLNRQPVPMPKDMNTWPVVLQRIVDVPCFCMFVRRAGDIIHPDHIGKLLKLVAPAVIQNPDIQLVLRPVNAQ